MKLQLPMGWQAECLLTDGVAFVQNAVLRLDHADKAYRKLIKSQFGHDILHEDTTLILTDAIGKKKLYYSFKDDKLSVGQEIRLLKTEEIIAEYHCMLPKAIESTISETIDLRDSNTIKEYKIYHCTDEMLAFKPIVQQPREYVGTVQARTLEEAYAVSQNSIKGWHPTKNIRSTSVGDIIEEEGVCYLVAGMGFKILPDVKFSQAGEEISEAQLQFYEEELLREATKDRL